jgi:hypothetical protein
VVNAVQEEEKEEETKEREVLMNCNNQTGSNCFGNCCNCPYQYYQPGYRQPYFTPTYYPPIMIERPGKSEKEKVEELKRLMKKIEEEKNE